MKVWLLYIVLLFGLLFLVIPDPTGTKDYFLFSDVQLTFQTYVYFICERLVLIALGYIIASEAREHREICNVFFLLMIGDLIDFVCCYNEVWFKLFYVPISYNVFSVVVFGASIIAFRKDN